MMKRNALLRLALIGVLLGAFALRLYRLDYQELRGDEAFGYFFSQRPYGEIITATIALAEPHPVASYFVQKAWLALTDTTGGANEFALRFPGAWWGVLAVALLYRLGRRLSFAPSTSLLAGALLAASPYAIWHAQDARMYSMSLALTTAGVLFGLEALERRHWPWAVAYILAASLALHTHYFAAFVLLALNLSVLVWTALGQRLRPMLVQWLLWQVIVAALYLPWLLRAGAILSGYRGNGDSPGLFEALRRALAVFAAGESASPDLGGWWAALAALLLLIGVVRLALGSAEQRRALLLLALYLCLPLLATWWSAQARPIFNERYLVAALPPFYLLLAAACAPLQSRSQSQSPGALPRTWQRAVQGLAGALAAVLLVGMGLSLASAFHDPAYSKTRGWRELSEVIEELSAGLQPERVRVAQNFPDPTLWYYYRGPVEHLVLPPQANDAAGARAVAQSLAQQGIERVILPIQPAANWDAEGLATMALDGWYDRAAQTQEGVWPLQVYAQPSSALIPVNASFGDDFTLRGFTAAPDTLPPGGLLTVHVDWAAGAAPATTGGETNTTPSTTADADLDAGADAGLVAGAGLAAVGERKVFVQLLDSEGQLVAQDDRPLVLTGPRAAGTGLAVYGLRLPPTLDSGPYRLIAGIYDPAQPGAPRLPTADGADHVVLREY